MIDLKQTELGMNVQTAQAHLDGLEKTKTDNENRVIDYRLKKEAFTLELDALNALDYDSLPQDLKHKMLNLEGYCRDIDGQIRLETEDKVTMAHNLNMANTSLARHRNTYSDYVHKDDMTLTSIDKEFMKNNTLGSMSTEKISQMVAKYGSHEAFMANVRMI